MPISIQANIPGRRNARSQATRRSQEAPEQSLTESLREPRVRTHRPHHRSPPRRRVGGSNSSSLEAQKPAADRSPRLIRPTAPRASRSCTTLFEKRNPRPERPRRRPVRAPPRRSARRQFLPLRQRPYAVPHHSLRPWRPYGASAASLPAHAKEVDYSPLLLRWRKRPYSRCSPHRPVSNVETLREARKPAALVTAALSQSAIGDEPRDHRMEARMPRPIVP